MINKIVSFILIPLMMLSFTELKLHVHICSESGKITTDLHPSNEVHRVICDCKPLDQEEASCCQDECSRDMIPSAHSCCIDIEKDVNTDANYKLTSNESSADSVITQLHRTVDYGIARLDHKVYISRFQPPNPYSPVTVLRL